MRPSPSTQDIRYPGSGSETGPSGRGQPAPGTSTSAAEKRASRDSSSAAARSRSLREPVEKLFRTVRPPASRTTRRPSPSCRTHSDTGGEGGVGPFGRGTWRMVVMEIDRWPEQRWHETWRAGKVQLDPPDGGDLSVGAGSGISH